MSDNPVNALHGKRQTAVQTLAEGTDAPSLAADVNDDTLLAVQQELVEALGIIGPQTMDDTHKHGAVTNIIAAMVLADLQTGLDHSARLPTEYSDSGPAGVPHHHPLAEVKELPEPTVKALGEHYNVSEIIDYEGDSNYVLAVQMHLATALLELNGTRFPENYSAGCSLLAAMLLVDTIHNGHTELALETVTKTASGEEWQTEDDEPFEYETEAIDVEVIVPEEAHAKSQ